MGYNAVWAVFQPFTYSRTSLLFDDFAKALSLADHVVMSEIMGGREKNTQGIYTADLAAKIPNAVWFEGFPEIADYVLANAKPGDLILTMGCGDVYKCANMMLARGE
jgi:UDP-N-acetylmuramate--alanine ligase